QFVNDTRPLLQDSNGSISRFSSIRSSEIIAAGYEPEYEVWYQPKDETVHERLFLVPEERFDAVKIDVEADCFKNINELAQTRWEMDDDGQLTPILLLKQKGWDKDSSRVARFTPDTNRDHRAMYYSENAGHNSTVASLRIKPKSPAGKPGEPNKDR